MTIGHLLFIVAILAIAFAFVLLLAVLAIIWATEEALSFICRYRQRRSEIEQRVRRNRAWAEEMYRGRV